MPSNVLLYRFDSWERFSNLKFMGLFYNKQKAPAPYTVLDKALICQHCGNETFIMEESVIHFRGEISNRAATVFICANCTHVHWFMGEQPNIPRMPG